MKNNPNLLKRKSYKKVIPFYHNCFLRFIDDDAVEQFPSRTIHDIKEAQSRAQSMSVDPNDFNNFFFEHLKSRHKTNTYKSVTVIDVVAYDKNDNEVILKSFVTMWAK